MLVSVANVKQQFQLRLLVGIWILSALAFWFWWLAPSHCTDGLHFTLNTVILGWTTLLPGYYFYFLCRMKKASPELPIPQAWRVAMVVTRAPAEPFELVKRTLLAMMAQGVPHDTWLADEDPTPEIRDWCDRHGIFLSTRKGHPDYHRPDWPRREKCKEGNLAYFYDAYGYDRYDIVVQLDADHLPMKGYLAAMLRPFVDPAVGYVSAPSICDANASTSWIARGRLFSEATLHGTLQAGYTNGWAPLCIGSHYAVRTQALAQIGGLGPELAEDHSTTLLMNAHGWKGVHAIDAEAHGDGPATFADAMVQEFQWARSLIVILLTLTPKHLGRLPAKLKFQFLFAQLWYPLFGLVMLGACALPLCALLTGVPWVQVSYLEFLAYSLWPTSSAVLLVAWVGRQGWLRPEGAKLLSWEAALFQLARWPWVLLGVASAVRASVFKHKVTWRVTPKQRSRAAALPVQLLMPYVCISLLSAVASLVTSPKADVRGYYWFTLTNWFCYLLVVIISLYCHLKENE